MALIKALGSTKIIGKVEPLAILTYLRRILAFKVNIIISIEQTLFESKTELIYPLIFSNY